MADISESEVLGKIAELNADEHVDGFIVQLPLPDHISEHRVIEAIDPSKDADGFHPVNIGRMTIGLPSYLPATPYGILELIKRYDIPTAEKGVWLWEKQYCGPTGQYPDVAKRHRRHGNCCP